MSRFFKKCKIIKKFYLSHIYKKISTPQKNLKERVAKLIDLNPRKNRIKVVEELETIRTDEIKNLEEIGMEVLMLKGKIRFEKIKNN